MRASHGPGGWRYDAIVTLTTPSLIGLYGTFVKWLTFGRTKHACWSMDLHPDCEFALGMWKPSHPLYAALNWLNGLHFRQAHATVALGHCMEERLSAKRVRGDRLRVIGVRLAGDRAECERLGRNGRTYMLAHHDRTVCCDQWAQLLESLKS